MGPIESSLRQSLVTALTPVHLVLTNESSKHAGHAGAQSGPVGETHWRVLVVSEAFAGLPQVKRHQAVYRALTAEFAAGLHALALQTVTPAEWQAKTSTPTS